MKGSFIYKIKIWRNTRRPLVYNELTQPQRQHNMQSRWGFPPRIWWRWWWWRYSGDTAFGPRIPGTCKGSCERAVLPRQCSPLERNYAILKNLHLVAKIHILKLKIEALGPHCSLSQPENIQTRRYGILVVTQHYLIKDLPSDNCIHYMSQEDWEKKWGNEGWSIS